MRINGRNMADFSHPIGQWPKARLAPIVARCAFVCQLHATKSKADRDSANFAQLRSVKPLQLFKNVPNL
jgi:hypothetical protein